MQSQGILVPPSENKEHEQLWNETWMRLDRFLPQFFAEIFPEEAQKLRSGAAVPKRSTESQTMAPRVGTPLSSSVRGSEDVQEAKKSSEKANVA